MQDSVRSHVDVFDDPPVPELGVVVALKSASIAKTRLDLPAPLRQQLTRSMALDTLTALSNIAAKLVVVTNDPGWDTTLNAAGLGVDRVPEPQQQGLNRALAAGDHVLRQASFERVLACVGDLPALRTASLMTIMHAVGHTGGQVRHFLADASGTGTTMLLATRSPLNPCFGGASAAAHRASGAVAVTDTKLDTPVPDARSDVDVVHDLWIASRLGLGNATAAMIGSGQLDI